MIKPNGCFEVQCFSGPLEIEHGNAVSKNVVDPPELYRLGINEHGAV